MSALPALDTIRQSLGDLASVVPDTRLIVLFGSAAKGRTHDASDIDVAVLCEGAASLDRLYLVLAPRFRSDRLHLVDLRHTGPLLAFEVARSGVLLFESQPSLFRQFQSLASRRYADTRKLRDAQRRAVEVFLHPESGA